MIDKNTQLAAQMDNLRRGYLDGLPDKLEKITAIAQNLSGTEADHYILAELHQDLHHLASSGGTFGLHQLSEQVRLLELAVYRRLQDSVMIDAPLRRQWLRDIAELSQTVPAKDTHPIPDLTIAQAYHAESKLVKLWLVDDDEQLGLNLKQILTQCGYDVSLFTRLEQLEAATDQHGPDVLIMDVLFSSKSLHDTEEILQQPAFRTLLCPVIFISAHGDFASRIRAARFGAKGFLLKPLDIPALVDLLEQINQARYKILHRILIVDADESLASHYALVLKRAGMEVSVLSQPELIIETISAFRPELILMDISLPGYSGPEIESVIRQHEGWTGLPIVYLASETGLDNHIRAMGIGADDFLTKPISDIRLVAAVTVRAAKARQLSDLMSRDSLTSLFKHSRIKEELAIEIERSKRNGTDVSIAMIGLDHFKLINDSFGHAAGDHVLRAISQLLKQRLRKSDVVGRYGVEEFVIILPACNLATTQRIMNDLRERFAILRFHHEGAEFSCTLSAGLSSNAQFSVTVPEAFLASADRALQNAKQAGRNQICSATENTQ